MFQRQLILKHRQTPATFCHQPLGPTSPRALLSSQSPRQRGMFLAPPEMGLLQILPAAMQTHADESALTVGVRESGTVSYLAPTHQPGQGLQPVLLQPLNPHFCACTSSKHCPVSPTDPPVEVLLTDGRHVGWTCPMEQEPLIHLFRFIELLHLQLLPRDRKKKKKKDMLSWFKRGQFPSSSPPTFGSWRNSDTNHSQWGYCLLCTSVGTLLHSWLLPAKQKVLSIAMDCVTHNFIPHERVKRQTSLDWELVSSQVI